MKKRQFLPIFIIAVLVLSLFGSATPSQGFKGAKAQPILVELATQTPRQMVRVIVQKMAGATGTEERVSALGGQVTENLHIINAFAAEMSAKDAVQLSKASNVRWVSLDAAVESSVCAQCVDTKNLANAYISAIRADQVECQALHPGAGYRGGGY
jgi:hypothetical protein